MAHELNQPLTAVTNYLEAGRYRATVPAAANTTASALLPVDGIRIVLIIGAVPWSRLL